MDKLIPGTHIYWAEYRCRCCGKLPPDFYISINKKAINLKYTMLFAAFEQTRKEYGGPIIISRGYSCPKHQLFIFLNKIKEKYGSLSKESILEAIKDPGLTLYSVHPFGLALDLLPPKKDIQKVVQAAKKARPKLRIGWKAYQNNEHPHIHIDHGYKIYPRYSSKLREGAEW